MSLYESDLALLIQTDSAQLHTAPANFGKRLRSAPITAFVGILYTHEKYTSTNNLFSIKLQYNVHSHCILYIVMVIILKIFMPIPALIAIIWNGEGVFSISDSNRGVASDWLNYVHLVLEWLSAEKF